MLRVARRQLPPDVYGRLRAHWWRLRAHLPAEAPLVVPGLPGRVHRADTMMFGWSDHSLQRYAEVGRSAMANIDASLQSTGRDSTFLRRVLDFPCGYGRVLRHMRVAWPHVRLTAADLDPRGVGFCAEEFGATPLISQVEFSRIVFPERYDLIFVGSLVTHLTSDRGMELLAVLAAVLEPHGLLVFSTQCDVSLARLAWYRGPTADRAERIRTITLTRGHCYNPEDRMAFHTPEGIRSSLATRCSGLRLIYHAAQGWDHHQDIWAYQGPGE